MKDQPDRKDIEQALPLKLPERLRRMRGYHLMHQSEVAALLHMDRSTYAYYETGGVSAVVIHAHEAGHALWRLHRLPARYAPEGRRRHTENIGLTDVRL